MLLKNELPRGKMDDHAFPTTPRGKWSLQDSPSQISPQHPKTLLVISKCSHSTPGISTAKELALAVKLADHQQEKEKVPTFQQPSWEGIHFRIYEEDIEVTYSFCVSGSAIDSKERCSQEIHQSWLIVMKKMP